MTDLFSVVSNALFAFNQFKEVLVGTVTGGIGLLILAFVLYVHFDSRRFPGKVTAVRVTTPDPGILLSRSSGKTRFAGEMYRAEFAYRDENGAVVNVAEAATSNQLGNKVPGQPVLLYKTPGVAEIERAGVLLPSIGVFFLAIGLFFSLDGFAQYKFNIFSIAIPAGFLLVVLFRARRWFDPVYRRTQREAWRQKKREAKIAGRPLTDSELRERMAVQCGATRGFTVFLIFMSLFSIGSGVIVSRNIGHLVKAGHRVEGTVTDLQPAQQMHDMAGLTYFPTVAFTEPSGRQRQFRDNIGGNPPRFRIGDKVKVLYDTTHAQIDHGAGNWLLPDTMFLIAAVCMLFAFRFYGGYRAMARFLAASPA